MSETILKSRSVGKVEEEAPADFLEKEEAEETIMDGKKESRTVHVKLDIVWRNVILFVLLHTGALVGLYSLVFQAKWMTLLWVYGLHVAGGLSITAGAHRLWSHKTYKAKLPVRALLVFFNCIAFQNDIIEWARDHRCHHKWSETDGDPHNASRGMFFAHIGWLMVRKHPEVARRGKTLDLGDLYADKLLVWQKRLYPFLAVTFCFVMPTVVPVYFWGENAKTAFLTAAILRYACTLHVTWCVNSVAHMFGSRPYDKKISPVQSMVTSFNALGEGFHNYHHTFPQDYRTSEYPWRLNATTLFIDFCSLIGLASHRKTVPQEKIDRQKLRYGDGSECPNEY